MFFQSGVDSQFLLTYKWRWNCHSTVLQPVWNYICLKMHVEPCQPKRNLWDDNERLHFYLSYCFKDLDSTTSEFRAKMLVGMLDKNKSTCMQACWTQLPLNCFFLSEVIPPFVPRSHNCQPLNINPGSNIQPSQIADANVFCTPQLIITHYTSLFSPWRLHWAGSLLHCLNESREGSHCSSDSLCCYHFYQTIRG